MKICFFADGKSVHTQRWCNHFKSMGHEIYLITFRDISIDGVQVYFINSGNIDVSGGNWKVLLKYREIRRIVKKIKPDIFHAHYATSYGVVGAMVNYHPFVITALGSDILISPKQSKIYSILLKFAFRRADWITAMADHMKTETIKLGALEKITDVVPFGIDPEIFNSEGRIENKDVFVITSTRNFETVYNLPHLIEAVSLIRERIKNIRLNLIGDGSKREEIETLIREKNLSDITTFYGRIPQPQIAEVLKKSNVFVTVSLSDGNNISLNEAMACGAYCIATDIPANTQWIEDGINGMLVKINDTKGLAEKLIFANANYTELQRVARPLNEQIINEKALWPVNMKRVEEKYKKLISK